jgi:hypothetical protein
MRWSICRFESPRQYAPAVWSSLKCLSQPGVGHVRAAAQVDEVAVAVGRDHLALGQVGDALELERVVAEHLARLVARHLAPLEGELLLRDAAHLGLERREVLGRERLRDLEVVVEAVVDGRAEADLRVGAQAAHGRGERVRARVAQHGERLGVALGEHAERAAAPQRRHEVLHLAVDAHRDGRAQQPLADRRDHVARQRARGDLARRPVGEREHEHVVGALGRAVGEGEGGARHGARDGGRGVLGGLLLAPPAPSPARVAAKAAAPGASAQRVTSQRARAPAAAVRRR